MSNGRMQATRWLLLLYCVMFGLLCGAGMFQSIVVVPGWSSGAEILRSYAHGGGFFPFVTPPLTLIALVLVFVGWRAPQPMKRWLYASLTGFLFLVATTFAYFLPVLASLEHDPLTAAEFAAKKESWAQLDRMRQVAGVLLFAAAVHAYGLWHPSVARQGAVVEDGAMQPQHT